MSDAASRLPNLYQLLGLKPLESDRGKIAAAIKRLQKPEASATAASREELERNQKISALAQKYLLDPQRKTAYDQQWKAVYQTGSSTAEQPAAGEKSAVRDARNASGSKAPLVAAPAAATLSAPASLAGAPSPRWDYSKLDQLLPEGDPQAAFDMASFLRAGGESRDPLAAEADLAKLIALLSDAAGGNESASAVLSTQAAPAALEHNAYSEATGHSLGLPPSSGGAQSVSHGNNLARRRRQRKQRALLLGGAALAAGLGGLLLFGVYLFRPKSNASDSQLARAGQEKSQPARSSGLSKIDLTARPEAAGASQNGQLDAGPVGSGLPKPGEGAMNLMSNASPPATPNSASMPEPMPMPEPTPAPNAMTTPATQPPATQPPAGNVPTMPAAPAPEADPKPEGEPKSETQPSAQPSAVPAAEPELSSDEKRAWQMGMTKAQSLIGQQDFEAAEKQLSDLKPAAKTGQQRGQLERLEQVLGFVKDIRQAMVEAIAGLGPADAFKVGSSTMASFVEGDDRRLTVRISGRNRSYLLEELPVALGLALVDLKMDVENASSLARKGAYILTHPKGEAAHERGKQMLQAAADAGAITPEMAKFYEDDYSLQSSDR